MSGKVIVYCDLMSQPARAVYWFGLLANVPNFELKLVQIIKQQHLTPEYAKVNPHQKIPALDDNGFKLGESAAIMKYLARKYKAADHWYPQDLAAQAKVDEYLQWHHMNVRLPCVTVFRLEFLYPQLGKAVAKPEQLERAYKELAKSLRSFETVYLAGNKDFIGGAQPCIGDISALEEIIQLRATAFDLSPFPKIQAWILRMEQLPQFEAAHKILNFVAQRVKTPKL